MNVVVEEPFSSGGLVSFLIQPDCNLLIPHTSIVKVFDGVVKELLIFGIGCNEKVPSFQNHIETEVDIYVIRGWDNAPVGNYSTVTDLARLRG
jgi:hypothetical protein